VNHLAFRIYPVWEADRATRLTIRLPEDAGVEINSESSFLSSFSIDKREFDEVEDDVYQNDKFGQTDKELIFNVDIGLGSIDIESCGR